MPRATGTFEVQLAPQPADDDPRGAPLARMTIDKHFAGDLQGRSRGQMLSARTPVQGSAGYVAMEVVTATLGGRRGSFVLQHSGTMRRGEATLALSVVPDSATGELAGLAGTMAIDAADGRHAYRFDYTVAEPA